MMIPTDATIDNLPAAAWLASLTGRLVADLHAAGIDDPLGESLTLACVLADLFQIAGLPLPADIRQRIASAEPAPAAPQPAPEHAFASVQVS